MNKFLNHLKRFKFNEFNSKEYNNEKAIISFTSWKKRIDYVYKTLETLISQTIKCHIVLVLSSDEFPQKEKELPQSLLMMLDYFEILWVKENTKAFKKVYPTIVKYQNLDVPILCADDDCSYLLTYAEEMIDFFNREGRNCCVSYNGLNSVIAKKKGIIQGCGGASGLYPPCYFNYFIDYYNRILRKNDKKIIYNFGDDSVGFIIKENNLNYKKIHEYNEGEETIRPFHFNETIKICPLHPQIHN